MVAGVKLKAFSTVFALVFLVFSGCVDKETPKKVSLTTKNRDIQPEIEYTPQDIIWFGFDPGLSPKEDMRTYIPLLKYLEGATGRRFRIKFSGKHEDTIGDLGKGVTHFAAVGALSFVIGEDLFGIKSLVSGVNRDGDTTYPSIIFTRSQSSIQSLQDLKGKCLAFDSRISAQGHLIPRKMLEEEGIKLDDLGTYIYTGSYLETIRSVLNGECDAGGIQESLAKTLASEGKIRILKISEAFPGSIIAYSNYADSRIVEAVRAALLALDPQGKHKSLLVDWDRTEMPLGFSKVSELELGKIKALAREYRVLTK